MKFTLASFSRFDFLGVLLLRVGAGAVIAYIGFPLFLAGPDSWKDVGEAVRYVGIDNFFLPIGLVSTLLQALGGLALIFGIFTRGVALLLSIIMGFAVAGMAYTSGFNTNLLVAIQLGLVFLSLVFIGPGRLSLDRRGI